MTSFSIPPWAWEQAEECAGLACAGVDTFAERLAYRDAKALLVSMLSDDLQPKVNEIIGAAIRCRMVGRAA